MTLQYWREYRTYFHIAQSWGVNESTAQRTIQSVEDTLMQSGRYASARKEATLCSRRSARSVGGHELVRVNLDESISTVAP